MAKRQTRRSITVSGKTYARAKAFCEREGRSIAGYFEELAVADLDWRNEPTVERSPYAYEKREMTDRMAPNPTRPEGPRSRE